MARASFFDAQAGIPLYNIPLTGESMRSIPLGEVDAVVGNPPYIRQEGIDPVEKSNYGELFRTEWPGQTMLSGRSDIYAYFFTHAASLLKPGGYLGFVTSIGWLDTDYGFKLQEFFLRNFRIVAVIESQVEKWFEDARVTTAVTILQREQDTANRDDNLVRFIQLKRPLAEIYSAALDKPLSDEGEAARQADMDAIRDLIAEIDTSQITDYWRVRVRTQRELWQDGIALSTHDESDGDATARYAGGKWGQHVRGPDSWFQLLERSRSRMAPLSELARVSRGFTSGADRFYCVRDVTPAASRQHPGPAGVLRPLGNLTQRHQTHTHSERRHEGGTSCREALPRSPSFTLLWRSNAPSYAEETWDAWQSMRPSHERGSGARTWRTTSHMPNAKAGILDQP